AQWQRFCEVAGRSDLVDHARYRTNALRVANRPEVVAIVEEILAQRTCEEWFRILGAARVPASPIQSIVELLEHPHTRARDIVGAFDVPGPNGHSIAVPIVLDGQPRRLGRRPPAYGADTGRILRSLGYSEGQIDS